MRRNFIKHKQLVLCLIVVLGIGAGGYAALRFSSAAIFTAASESESGTRQGNAKVIGDSSASGGSALQFGENAAQIVITNTPAQSAALVYGSDMTNVSQYAKPGGLVVAGRDNYQDAPIKNVSAKGGTVLIYLDALIDADYGRYHNLLLNTSECGAAVPKWPGGPKANEYGYLTDFRVGGVLQGKLECVLEKMVAENPHMGGWFADDLGSRSWYPLIDWSTWSTSDKQAYRDGAVALSQTFRKVANRHGLIFIVNGTWGGGSMASNGGGYPDISKHGNALADGGFLENHGANEVSYFGPYGCSNQWATQSPITRGKAFNYSVNKIQSDTDAWRNSGCYAFAATQSDYGVAPVPYSALHATGLPSKVGNTVSL